MKRNRMLALAAILALVLMAMPAMFLAQAGAAPELEYLDAIESVTFDPTRGSADLSVATDADKTAVEYFLKSNLSMVAGDAFTWFDYTDSISLNGKKATGYQIFSVSGSVSGGSGSNVIVALKDGFSGLEARLIDLNYAPGAANPFVNPIDNPTDRANYADGLWMCSNRNGYFALVYFGMLPGQTTPPTEAPTDAPTETPTIEVTETPTDAPTVEPSPTAPPHEHGDNCVKLGDADLTGWDEDLDIDDILAVRADMFGIEQLTGRALYAADITKTGVIDIDVILAIRGDMFGLSTTDIDCDYDAGGPIDEPTDEPTDEPSAEPTTESSYPPPMPIA